MATNVADWSGSGFASVFCVPGFYTLWSPAPKEAVREVAFIILTYSSAHTAYGHPKRP